MMENNMTEKHDMPSKIKIIPPRMFAIFKNRLSCAKVVLSKEDLDLINLSINDKINTLKFARDNFIDLYKKIKNLDILQISLKYEIKIKDFQKAQENLIKLYKVQNGL